MRVCDKCKKPIKNGDLNAKIDLGHPFIYDICKKCREKFLLHVDDFFVTKEDEK